MPDERGLGNEGDRNAVYGRQEAFSPARGDFQIVSRRGEHVVSKLWIQLFKDFFRDVDSFCDIFNAHPLFHGHGLKMKRRVGPHGGEAVFLQVVDDMQCRHESGNVFRRLLWQAFIKVPEIVKVIHLLVSDHPQHFAFAAVVGRQRRHPVPEQFMKSL